MVVLKITKKRLDVANPELSDSDYSIRLNVNLMAKEYQVKQGKSIVGEIVSTDINLKPYQYFDFEVLIHLNRITTNKENTDVIFSVDLDATTVFQDDSNIIGNVISQNNSIMNMQTNDKPVSDDDIRDMTRNYADRINNMVSSKFHE